MKPDFHLVKSIVRQAITQANGTLVADTATAIATLRTLQATNWTALQGQGGQLVSSTVAGRTFTFAASDAGSPDGMMRATEAAIEFLESCDTPTTAKAKLVKRTRIYPDFSGMLR